MTLRPPRTNPTNSNEMRESALEYEIAQEQAAALGRLGRALEAALAALAQHDGRHGQAGKAQDFAAASAPCENAWSRRPATRCGALSSSAKPADFATKG